MIYLIIAGAAVLGVAVLFLYAKAQGKEAKENEYLKDSTDMVQRKSKIKEKVSDYHSDDFTYR